jgi:phosphoribosylpyrophosphate synthetase
LLARLEFAACYVYTRRGESAAAVGARQIRDAIKRGNPDAMTRAAARVAQVSQETPPFAAFFGPNVTLVPTPGSAPRRGDSLWVPDRIAKALQAQGLAAAVEPLLERVEAVPKSAYAAPGDRPTVEQHCASLRVTSLLTPGQELVLVDDVVTKGRTLLAAASVLASSFPEARIRAFALIRYQGFAEDLEAPLSPVTGEITWEGGDARRSI